MHKLTRALALALSVVVVPCSVGAQTFTNPIRLVVPFPPGGSMDTVGRALADGLSKVTNETIIVENKPGADGIIAAELVKRAKPDGRVLLFASNTALNAVPTMRKDAPYDPVKDFTPVSLVGRLGVYLFVREDFPAKTVKELVDHARAHPGTLKYGAGTATSQLASAQLISLSKIKMTEIPYKGDGTLMLDLVAGRLDLSIASPVPGLSLARAGKLRMLAVFSEQRNPEFPSVPTIAEAGMPEHALVAWAGIFGPANMPRDIAEKLSKDIGTVLAQPDVKSAFRVADFHPSGSSPDLLRDFLKTQLALWEKGVADAGIEKQ